MGRVIVPGDRVQPAPARIYDYLLGGSDNYVVDRAVADQVLVGAPDLRQLAQANRAFEIRAVRVLAAAGIRQFIDLGTGYPTTPSVHEAARQQAPSSRVVYVDNDPVVHVHNTALLAVDDRMASVLADVRQPEVILDHPDVARLIDFGQPVGVLCVAVLHLVPDAAGPGGDHRPVPGPHLRGQLPGAVPVRRRQRPCGGGRAARGRGGHPVEIPFRSRRQIRGSFGGFELLEPGPADVQD